MSEPTDAARGLSPDSLTGDAAAPDFPDRAQYEIGRSEIGIHGEPRKSDQTRCHGGRNLAVDQLSRTSLAEWMSLPRRPRSRLPGQHHGRPPSGSCWIMASPSSSQRLPRAKAVAVTQSRRPCIAHIFSEWWARPSPLMKLDDELKDLLANPWRLGLRCRSAGSLDAWVPGVPHHRMDGHDWHAQGRARPPGSSPSARAPSPTRPRGTSPRSCASGAPFSKHSAPPSRAR